jgi:hypothetical protein
MVRFVCPGCRSKLNAKARLAGQTGNCPKCGTPVQIPTTDAEPDLPLEETVPLEDALPEEHIHGVIEQGLPEVKTLRELEYPNRYWILDRVRILAVWSGDGLGWMRKTSTGLVPARRDPTQLPAHGSFTIVAVLMKTTDQGLRLVGIRSYKLAERWSLPSLAKGEELILTHLRGPGSLNVEQKLLVWNQIRSEFMPEVWEGAQNVRQYLFNADYKSAGTE